MDRPIAWIRSTDALAAEVRRVGSGPLALDSESDSLHRYPEKVCLVQLSHGGRDALVDPLAGLDMAPLAPLLADAGVTKILHGADYDLRALHRDFGLEIRGLFDTMIAARLVGERAFGLAALLERFLDVRLDKKFQRADWSKRPLTPEMEAYAVLDTRHLERLAELLRDRLEETGRTAWAQEEFERLETVRWDDDPERKTDAFRRVKKSSSLDRRGLAVLRELHAFREAEAIRKGRPPYRIVRDEVLLELARRPSVDPAIVKKVRGMPRPLLSGRMHEALLQAIERGLALPEDELPERAEPRRGRRPPPELERRLRKLARHRDGVAERLGLEPAVVATRGVLEQVQARLDAGEPLEGIEGLRDWQAKVLFADGPPGGPSAE